MVCIQFVQFFQWSIGYSTYLGRVQLASNPLKELLKYVENNDLATTEPNSHMNFFIHQNKHLFGEKIKPGSGIGSSAASAAGSVFGMNYLLGNPYTNEELTTFAMKGEAIASKSEHADNIAPALFGGFTLVKSNQPFEVLQIPTPKELYVVIAHQQIEIKTSEARSILPKEIPLSDAITQWANLGSLIHALHTSDYTLIGSSLKDVVVEPHRSKLIPNFKALKNSALDANALGTSISGSGPSIFSLCKGENVAHQVKNAQKKLLESTQIPFEIYVSKINTQGIKILTQ